MFENLLILTMDGADLQYHVALDKKTGQTVWKTDRSATWNDEERAGTDGEGWGYAQSPQHAVDRVRRRGKRRLLSPGAKAAYAYDPRPGVNFGRFSTPTFRSRPAAVRSRPGPS